MRITITTVLGLVATLAALGGTSIPRHGARHLQLGHGPVETSLLEARHVTAAAAASRLEVRDPGARAWPPKKPSKEEVIRHAQTAGIIAAGVAAVGATVYVVHKAKQAMTKSKCNPDPNCPKGSETPLFPGKLKARFTPGPAMSIGAYQAGQRDGAQTNAPLCPCGPVNPG